MANVWGLEREVVGVLLKGDYGAIGRLGTLAICGAIFGIYVATVLAGIDRALLRGGRRAR